MCIHAGMRPVKALRMSAGLGAMGYGMASNVRKKMASDNTLYIFDVDRAVCQKFQTEFSSYGKIEIAANARGTADDSVGVVSILPSAPTVRETFLHESTGIIAAKKDRTRVLLECSTISSSSTKRIGLEAMAAESGLYVDGPVSVSLSLFPAVHDDRPHSRDVSLINISREAPLLRRRGHSPSSWGTRRGHIRAQPRSVCGSWS